MLESMPGLPVCFREGAYVYEGTSREYAWPRGMALRILNWLQEQKLAVVHAEIWLPTKPGPTIPAPYIYVWEPDDKSDDETWDQYVHSSIEGAREYVSTFEWDEKDVDFRRETPFFNFTPCSEEQYHEPIPE